MPRPDWRARSTYSWKTSVQLENVVPVLYHGGEVLLQEIAGGHSLRRRAHGFPPQLAMRAAPPAQVVVDADEHGDDVDGGVRQRHHHGRHVVGVSAFEVLEHQAAIGIEDDPRRPPVGQRVAGHVRRRQTETRTASRTHLQTAAAPACPAAPGGRSPSRATATPLKSICFSVRNRAAVVGPSDLLTGGRNPRGPWPVTPARAVSPAMI